MMTNWNALIPDAPFDWALIPLDGRKRPIDPDTGDLKDDWQQQDGYDVDGISALNGQVHAVGLMLGEKSGGVLQVDYDGPASPAKFQEVYGKSPKDLPRTIGVTSGKESRGSRFFLVDRDWWDSLRGRKAWKDADGDICLELRWAGHQAVIAGKHPETSGYSWMANSSPADLEMAMAPDWLLEPLIRTEATYEPVQVSAEDAQRAIAMLQCIDPNSRTNYDGWLEIGMALHHTDEGLLFDWIEWSKQMPNFDEAECLQKWQGFADYKGQPLTIGTLHHYAKKGGYIEPKRQPVTKPQGGVEGDDDIASAGELLDISERLAEGRKLFSIHGLLPHDLADAVESLQRPLPTDDLSAVMAVITGYSGLMKLGTRVASSMSFSVPANLFAAMVMHSGGAKTAVKKTLVDAPAHDIRRDAARAHRQSMEQWQAQDKKDRAPIAPRPVFPHLSDYTPAALSQQLQHNESLGFGQLIIRDEMAGLLQAISNDAQQGSGTAEAQLLETFDGDGYSSIRVGDTPRSYENCHVSIFGNIQPELLRELINGEDSTGKFARFLFCRVPTKALLLSDEDPTDEERDAHESAQQKLRYYASKIYAEPPRVYKLSANARKAFNAWFNQHQQTALLPAMPGVVRSLLGKTSAHALRIAGNLHLLRVVSGECLATDRISPQTMDAAMAIVDQLTKETEAFHETPETDTTRLMRHIHQVSWVTGKPVDRQIIRDKCNRETRNHCTAPAFKAAVEVLVDHRYGEMITDRKSINGKRRVLQYAAIREMSQ